MRTVVTAVVLLLVVGCHQYRPKTRYMEEEYTPYAKDGKASVGGRAFLTLSNGKVITAAGQTVYLVPVTTRSTEAFDRGIVRNRPVEPELEPESDLVKKCKRTVQATEDGKFRFEGLPAGNYYVYSQIGYQTEGTGNHSKTTVVEVAYTKLTLAESEDKNVVATR